VLVIHSKLIIFFLITDKHLKSWIKLFIYLVCFLCVFSDYSVAKDLLSQESANPNDHNTSYSFVVWGHPRNVFAQPPLHFKEILERLSELKPDLIFVTGDVIEGGLGQYLTNNKRPPSNKIIEIIKKDWDRFDTAMKKLGIPYYITPGNHDVHSVQTRDIFYERYPKMPFAITFKGSRFILLDSGGIYNLGDNDAAFTGGPVSFDDEQKQFVRKEISIQKKYRHIFFFMHHTNQWANSDGFWWRDIHPMLRGGKTRAVFSANPDGYKFKYSYLVQNGIYYIQSCTFPVFSARSTAKAEPARKAFCKQLDNFQYVKVDGDDIKIRTIVVGATSSKGVSRPYWEEVDKIDEGVTWKRKWFNKLKKTISSSPRRILLVFTVWGGVCFLFGILSILFLIRLKK